MFKVLGGAVVGGAILSTGFNRVAAQSGGVLSFPVEFTNALGSFVGSFNVTEFAIQQGQVVALGTLVGTVTNALGDVVGAVEQALALPVLPSTTGSCEILHLELGPLDLNLLGLQVNLNQVVLDITAEPGSLLGDLLCAIANLLNGNGNALGRLRNLLNDLLGAL
jgi:hypothetical protein